ncbi:MAG: glycosyltransferase [Flavobacteriaceae bacterium]|nr:glycosyltransferase [Flavobacteriaceae bacterium]
MMRKQIKVDVLVPIFNDSSHISNFFDSVDSIKDPYLKKFLIHFIFVDDGSSDDSLDILLKERKKRKYITVVEFSRNFGKEAALFAGINISKGDALIVIDVDLQDPIELIPKMLRKWNFNEFDSVIAVRSTSLGSEAGLRRIVSRLYLRFFNFMSPIKMNLNVGETRLINRKMVTVFNTLQEKSRFTRGIFQWIGFKCAEVNFIRKPSPDKSRFTVAKLISLGINGITSFSVKPLRIVTFLGFFGSFFSILLAIFIVILRLTSIVSIPGYSSTILLILFGSSIQLFCIGILGEYVAKNLEESKNRPIYIVRNIFEN